MPAAISHYIHSLKVSDNAPDIVKNNDAFLWGAQGPDFFFCHRFLPWMKGNDRRELGNLLHQADPNKLLIDLYKYASVKNDKILYSYFYGFLCHYSFDSLAHPYINWKSKKLLESESNQTEEILHNEIESALDSLLLRNFNGSLPGDKNLNFTVPNNPQVINSISTLWSELIPEVLHKEITKEEVYQSLIDCRKVFSIATDKFGLKKSFLLKFEKNKNHSISCHIRPILEDMEYDYANMEHEEWGEDHNTFDFFQITDYAVDTAADLINGFYSKKINAENISVFTKNKPFG